LENANGCASTIVIIVAALITIFSSYFSVAIPPTNTNLSEEDYPFVLAKEGVDYSFIETFNCNFVIAGNVEVLDENTIDYENQVIMVQPLGTYDNRPAVIVRIGGDTHFGENGWSQLLIGNYWYLVWIQDLTLDVPLSAEVLVDNLDCSSERTLALVNFRQVLPLNQ
jgi:hypothetical protein